MAETVTLPGTKTKVPRWAVIAGGIGVVGAVVLLRGRQGERAPDESGLFAEEIAQRFEEERQSFAGAIEQLSAKIDEISQKAPEVPPAPPPAPRNGKPAPPPPVPTFPPTFPTDVVIDRPRDDGRSFTQRARELEAAAGRLPGGAARGFVAEAARLTGLAGLYAGGGSVPRSTRSTTTATRGRTAPTSPRFAPRRGFFTARQLEAAAGRLKQPIRGRAAEAARYTGLAEAYKAVPRGGGATSDFLIAHPDLDATGGGSGGFLAITPAATREFRRRTGITG